MYCDGKELPTDDRERGKDYNHSTFLDIIISALVGLRAAADEDSFTVASLYQAVAAAVRGLGGNADDDEGDVADSWFALDNVAYHGHNVSIAWDADGGRHFRDNCVGLCVWVDGVLKARAPGLRPPLRVPLA